VRRLPRSLGIALSRDARNVVRGNAHSPAWMPMTYAMLAIVLEGSVSGIAMMVDVATVDSGVADESVVTAESFVNGSVIDVRSYVSDGRTLTKRQLLALPARRLPS